MSQFDSDSGFGGDSRPDEGDILDPKIRKLLQAEANFSKSVSEVTSEMDGAMKKAFQVASQAGGLIEAQGVIIPGSYERTEAHTESQCHGDIMDLEIIFEGHGAAISARPVYSALSSIFDDEDLERSSLYKRIDGQDINQGEKGRIVKMTGDRQQIELATDNLKTLAEKMRMGRSLQRIQEIAALCLLLEQAEICKVHIQFNIRNDGIYPYVSSVKTLKDGNLTRVLSHMEGAGEPIDIDDWATSDFVERTDGVYITITDTRPAQNRFREMAKMLIQNKLPQGQTLSLRIEEGAQPDGNGLSDPSGPSL